MTPAEITLIRQALEMGATADYTMLTFPRNALCQRALEAFNSATTRQASGRVAKEQP